MLEVTVVKIKTVGELNVPRGTEQQVPHGVLVVSLPRVGDINALLVPLSDLPPGTREGDTLELIKRAK
jgi:hypothetical protein